MKTAKEMKALAEPINNANVAKSVASELIIIETMLEAEAKLGKFQIQLSKLSDGAALRLKDLGYEVWSDICYDSEYYNISFKND